MKGSEGRRPASDPSGREPEGAAAGPETGEAYTSRGKDYFRALIDNSSDVVTIVDSEGVIRFMSPSLERVLGYAPEEMEGRRALDLLGLVHPDELETARERLTRDLDKPGRGTIGRYRLRHRDGSWLHVEGSVNNLLQDEAIRGVIFNWRDVTERRRAEDALKRSEEYFRSLIENSYDAVTVIDPSGGIGYASPSFERMTGYSPEELVGRNAFAFIHPDDVPRVIEDLSRGLATEGGIVTSEYRYRHRDGSWRYVEAVGRNLIDDPSVGGFVVNFRDVSERKQAEDAMMAANRELRAFAYTVSHDLMTPLSVAYGYACLLESCSPRSLEEGGEWLEEITRSIAHMDRLLKSLLDYAQAESPIDLFVAVDPRAVIEELLRQLEADIAERGAVVEIQEELPPIRADRVRLGQVYANLLENALKHGGTGGPLRIELGAGRDGESIILHVRDNGRGIPDSELERIFEPFTRLVTDVSSHGLGIGLSTVRRVVERWGGRVWAESPPGEGSAFFFTAPAADA